MPRRRPQRPRLLQGHAVRLPHGVADKQNMAYPHEDNGAGAGALVRPGGPTPSISRYDKPSPTAKPLPSRGERRKRLPRESPSDSLRVGASGIVRRRADTKRADLTDGSNCDARSARTLRRMASPPRAPATQNAPCWSATSCSPTDYSAVPSALGGLTSGFGMGPGVPPLPWSLTNKGHSAVRGGRSRALGAAQRDVGPSSPIARARNEEKSSAD